MLIGIVAIFALWILSFIGLFLFAYLIESEFGKFEARFSILLLCFVFVISLIIPVGLIFFIASVLTFFIELASTKLSKIKQYEIRIKGYKKDKS